MAAYGVIMYTVMIFSAVFMGYSVGTSPLMSFQYGAQNHTEMRSLLWKSLGIIGVASIVMFLLGQWLAAPLSAIFVSYDAALLELTVSAYKLYALCFLFMGFAMYASAFFTALNNGLVSALISFLRTLVFHCARSCSKWRRSSCCRCCSASTASGSRSRWATGSPAWWPPRS